MAKFCPNCGKELKGDINFCGNCGGALKENAVQKSGVNPGLFEQRNIAVSIILTFVTCGIYGLYWFICMNDEANMLSNDGDKTSGGMSLLLVIVTCGIYYLYWIYMMGKKLYDAGKKYNMDIQDNSVVYLVLSIFGLSIIAECLIQNDLNKFAK